MTKGLFLRGISILFFILLFINESHCQSVDKAKLLQFEEAITRGEEFLQNKDYPKAKAEYQKALEIDPNAKYPKDKLAQIRKVYTDPQDETSFNNAVSKGDQLVVSGDYKAAKEQYAKALTIKPDDRTTREKMTNADKLITERDTRLKDFELVIKTADQYFADKKYPEALKSYKEANNLNPDDNYSAGKIKAIESQIAEQQAIDNRYNLSINEADEAYMNRDFSVAKTKYEQASAIKPSENYPKSMLERVAESIKNQANLSKVEEQEKAKLYAESKRQDSINAVLESQRIAAIKEEENRQALIASQQAAAQHKQDSLKIAEETKLEAAKQEEDARIKLEGIKALAEQQRQDSLKLAEKTKLEAAKQEEDARIKLEGMKALAEQQRQDSLKLAEETKLEAARQEEDARIKLEGMKALAEQQRQDSLKLDEETKLQAAKKEKDALIAENKRLEEEKQKQLEIEKRSVTDQEYYDAIEGADRLYAEQDFASAIKLYEKASDLKPAEDYPKNKIITSHNILLERLKNNIESYNKFIAAGDLAFQTKVFDKAIEEYEKAIETRPEETYPTQMIEKIKKLMDDNAMINLVDNSVILIDASEQRFSFKPIEMRFRKNNYIVIKAKKTTEKAPKLFINYGKDGLKSGGIVMKGIESDETTSYLLRISAQDMWYRNDNNWISIYPEGGDLEITSLQISQGDIVTTK